MMAERITLELVDGALEVEGPDEVVDAVAAELAADTGALALVLEVFGGAVEVVATNAPACWPPRGGFTPAWRRLQFRTLEVLPTEERPTIDPYAAEPPSVPCSNCAVPSGSALKERVFETGLWQTCARCQGRTFRSTPSGDVCARCTPPVPSAEPAPTWRRAGSGWVCGRCHPAPPPDRWPVCGRCGARGHAEPDHDRLVEWAERRLRRTRDPKRRRELEDALAQLAQRAGA
jgi:hypothetical protein